MAFAGAHVLAALSAVLPALLRSAAAAAPPSIVTGGHDDLYGALGEGILDEPSQYPHPPTLIPRSALPLRTSGRYVVGADGARVRLFCVNWYGAHLEQMVMNGLDRQPIEYLAARIRSLGFNCVRMPYSLDLLASDSPVPDPQISLAANPDLQGLTALEVFDASVETVTRAGLLVILNNHISSKGWCCSVADGQGLWYTKRYSQQQWLDYLGFVAERYHANPLVAGIDLRNEIRPSFLGSPKWGVQDPKNDWSVASVLGAEAALQQDPDLLVIISGLYYGLFLCDVPHKPVHLQVDALRNRTVYTVHEYKWLNFHIVARLVIGHLFMALVLWCSALLMYYGCQVGCPILFPQSCSAMARRRAARAGAPDAASAAGARRRCGCRGPVSCRCRCLGRMWGIFCAALALTCVSVAALWVSNSIVNICSSVWLVSKIFLFIIALVIGSLSAVMWGYLALRYGERMRERHVARRDALVDPSPCCSRQPASASASPGVHSAAEASTGSSSPSLGNTRASSSSTDAPCSSSTSCVGGTSLGGLVENGLSSSTGGLGSRKRLRTSFHKLRKFIGRPLAACFRSRKILPFLLLAGAMGAIVHLYMDFGSFEVFAEEIDSRWGFLINGPGAAPIWVGEFGTNTADDLWWSHMARYLRQQELDWAYWTLNGEQRANQPESFGLLNMDESTVQNPAILCQLQALMNLSNASSCHSLSWFGYAFR